MKHGYQKLCSANLMVQQLHINISGEYYYNFVNVSQVIRGDNLNVTESTRNSYILKSINIIINHDLRKS